MFKVIETIGKLTSGLFLVFNSKTGSYIKKGSAKSGRNGKTYYNTKKKS
jgi:hypothetical protein